MTAARSFTALPRPVLLDGQEKEVPVLSRAAEAAMGTRAAQEASGKIRSLTSAVARGDEAAFRRLYDLYHERLFRLVLVLGRGDEALAHDVVQSTMLTAAKKLKPLRSEAHLWNWLARVARQQLSKAWRRQKRDRALREAVEQSEFVGRDRSEGGMEAHLDAVLLALDLEDRQVVEWFYFERCGHKEIAERLGATPKAVSSRLERLRVRLRRLLLGRLSDEE